jgi:hypothetical protein
MAKIGSYGWSPRQMERINARRAERGKEQLVNIRNPITEEQYNMVLKGKSQPASKLEDDEEEPEMSLKERSEERTKKFMEKFTPKGSMGIERGVKGRSSGIMKKGIRGGVGTSMQDSYNQFTA